ncbi:hypothetical protein L208DRAFT_1416093, partial [Tricholoma matsutake]
MDVGQSPCSLTDILLPVLLATQAVPPIHPTSGCLQWWSWQVLSQFVASSHHQAHPVDQMSPHILFWVEGLYRWCTGHL